MLAVAVQEEHIVQDHAIVIVEYRVELAVMDVQDVVDHVYLHAEVVIMDVAEHVLVHVQDVLVHVQVVQDAEDVVAVLDVVDVILVVQEHVKIHVLDYVQEVDLKYL